MSFLYESSETVFDKPGRFSPYSVCPVFVGIFLPFWDHGFGLNLYDSCCYYFSGSNFWVGAIFCRMGSAAVPSLLED